MTYSSPAQMEALIGAIGDAIHIVVTCLAAALLKIFTQGGILLVLILVSLGFMFVYWAIRLIHLRGR